MKTLASLVPKSLIFHKARSNNPEPEPAIAHSELVEPSDLSIAARGKLSEEALEDILSIPSLTREAIKIVTGILLVLLSLKGLLIFYGAKDSTWLEQSINIVTAPVILPFRGLFTDSKAGEVPVFFSMICVLFLGVLLYVAVDLASKYSLRQKIQEKKALLSTQKPQSQP